MAAQFPPPHQQAHQQHQQFTNHQAMPPPQSAGAPPPPMPQLPPQMFTTAASLLDLTDKKLLVALRDGRKVVGVLRSWDQFGNLVLQDAVERTFAGGEAGVPAVYADVPRGVYLVRGENVTLMGEIDLDRDDDIPEPYRQAPEAEVFEQRQREQAARRRRDQAKQRAMRALGFEGEVGGEAIEL